MSYPNVDGYNSAQMSYSGGAQQNYPGGQQGGFGSSAPPAGYGQGNYPGNHQGGYAPGQTGYPSGGQHPGGPPSVNPDVQRWFNTVDRDRSGKITAKELQAALVNGQGRNFSDQACSLMIGMFDRDKSGTIDVQEFQQLYNYINQWIATFRSYDRDNSGHIEEAELSQAFQRMGYTFSPEFIKFLISKSDLQNHAKIAVDQFIVLCVQIERFTGLGEGDLTGQSYFDKSRRKRKCESPNNRQKEGEEEDEEEECKASVMDQINKLESKDELRRLKAELNNLVTENIQLINENKLLQEENRSLEKRAAHLEEETLRLRCENEKALELSSWLNSAKEIVEGLNEQTRNRRCLPPPKPHDHDPSHLWNEADKDAPFAIRNGNAAVKQERLDDQIPQDGEEYHTPLLNFDQVDFPGKEVSLIRIVQDSGHEPESPVDDVGRNQLLYPDPVEGVCELCPGSRIFVSLSSMETIMNKRTHSSVARSCLEAIFKTTYLLSCSVQGNVAKGPYGKPEFQRPSLYKPAVDCILKFSRHYAERNNWKVEELTTIKKQMNTRLSELRNLAKAKNASANLSLNLKVEAAAYQADNTRIPCTRCREEGNDHNPV